MRGNRNSKLFCFLSHNFVAQQKIGISEFYYY